MNKIKIQALRNDINAALAAVAAKHGLSKLAATNAKFTDSTVDFKLEAVEAGGLTKEAQRYAESAKMFGLPPLGTPVAFGTTTYTPTGMNTTGSKIIVSSSKDDKAYLYDTDKFAAAWKRQKAAAEAAKAIDKAAA